MGEHPGWWIELCRQHGQDPDDPDAFCAVSADQLEQMLRKAEAVYYARLIEDAEFTA